MKLTQPIFALLFLVMSAISVVGQTANNHIPLSYQFNQQLNGVVYSPATKFHSSVRGYLADDPVLSDAYNKLMNMGIDSTVDRTWARRKLTQEHLLDIKGADYTFYGDVVPDFQVGRDFEGSKSTWLNTRGFQFGGTVGKKFSFFTSGYENQGVFADYYQNFIDSNNVVPGQLGGGMKLIPNSKDWAYASSLISFTPNQYLNIALGYNKNFIGDGYRSMLLSDISSNYSYLRLRATVGDVQYQTILGYMLEPGYDMTIPEGRERNPDKWMSAHYADWNATNRLSVGVFLSTIWSDVKISDGSDTRIGFNAKYEVLEKTALYGQLMIDRESAWQLGLKGSDLFSVNRLNYLLEYNVAKPDTYSRHKHITRYTNYNQPLAHPFGADFREVVGLLNYSVKRFNFQGQALRAAYGMDSEKTTLSYGEVKAAYLINPKTNLRFEVGGIVRRESNDVSRLTTNWLTVGLRGTFRNLYTDF